MAEKTTLKEATVATLTARRLKGESLDVIADEIVAISIAMNRLRSTRLTDDALFLLIQNAAPTVGSKYKKRSMSVTQIKAVFDGIEAMKQKYLRPSKGKQ